MEWLGDDVQYIDAPVDPHVEMCTITKAFDNSKVIVANNVKRYPGVRMISNLYSRKERVCKFHNCADFRDIKLQLLQQNANPVPPKIVTNAPVQEETLIPGRDFGHIEEIFPIAQHTFTDGGRIFGAGSHLFLWESHSFPMGEAKFQCIGCHFVLTRNMPLLIWFQVEQET